MKHDILIYIKKQKLLKIDFVSESSQNDRT